MKIKEQTRKLAAGCSKHCFEVVDKTDEVSNHIYGKATLTWFEEIFEEYYEEYNIDQDIAVAKTFLEIHLPFLIDLVPSYFNLL
ncbi:TPA: hypothetical protein ACX3VK_000139 [Streptococcus pneumoniae]